MTYVKLEDAVETYMARRFGGSEEVVAALRSLPTDDGREACLGILAEEISGIEQSEQEDVKLYLALLYHIQDRIKAALGPLPAPPAC